jgi:plastocyanin
VTPGGNARPGRALALVLALLVSCVAAAAEDSAVAILTIIDETGAPVPGAVVMDDGRRDSRAGTGAQTPVVVDQRDKRFEPFVSVSRPGQSVLLPNSDDIRHHVYSFSKGNAFERKLYRANEAEPVQFSVEGVVALGCNIHDTMQAHVLVTSDPVSGPSDDQGRIYLSGPIAGLLPEGLVQLWHPMLNGEGFFLTLPISDTGSGPAVRLPFTWSDPQAGRSRGELEALLRQFSREDP